MAQKLDFDARYSVAGWKGIAFYIYGYPQKWEPCTYFGEDENGDEIEIDDIEEGEWVDDAQSGRVLVVMVGDDKKHEVDVEDLTPIDDLDYCLSCGQIGCTHDGRMRA